MKTLLWVIMMGGPFLILCKDRWLIFVGAMIIGAWIVGILGAGVASGRSPQDPE